MSHKYKEKTFRFTFKVFLRLAIFSLLVFMAFNYLTSSTDGHQAINLSPVLGESVTRPYLDAIYQQLPPESRNTLENFDNNPAIIGLKLKISEIQSQLNGFPQTQIKAIQKAIVKNVSDKLIESINGTP